MFKLRKKIHSEDFLAKYPASFKSAYAIFVVVMSAGSLVWGVFCIILGLHKISILPFGYLAFSLLGLIVFFSGRGFAFIRFFQVLFSLTFPYALQWLLGGYTASGMVSLWSFLTLIVLITFYEARYNILWLPLFIVCMVVGIGLDHYYPQPVPSMLNKPHIHKMLLIANASLVGSMLFFIGRHFISLNRQHKKINETLEYQKGELLQKHEEILAYNEEINQQNEEILAINDELGRQKEEMAAKNKEIALKNEAMTTINDALEQQRSELRKKTNNVRSSINYAKRIQRAILPRLSWIQEHFPESFVFFKPRDIVSGDFYWFSVVRLEENLEITTSFRPPPLPEKIIISAIDCTGHGVPGAFMSMVGNQLLHEIVNTNQITSPEEILRELHLKIRFSLNQEENENNDGMDMSLCVIDKQARTLEFAGAKNPLIYIQGDKLTEVKGDKMPIGGKKRSRDKKPKARTYTKHIVKLNEPTWFYIFTDGFQDQFGGKHDRKFMKKRFKELLLKIKDRPPNVQKNMLSQTIGGWMDGRHQIDDMLIMGFKIDDHILPRQAT
ncbi:SpoIIE family protein phosphatase [uncultured Microscilla sp.]|uniref:SpoIIE family protein phosphatase n=1 Tax=uncultured Microscilla sp. TaxID=432653 RepID=UPI00262D063B|nr:SpoIIE family protein phosphatase [uncultured Microscilla sp.]